MARQEVVRVTCDRCKREELQPYSNKEKQPDVELQFFGQRTVYHDLCGRCRGTITNILNKIGEWDREVHSKYGEVVDPHAVPPLTVAPDYSPPKPHSAAADKR